MELKYTRLHLNNYYTGWARGPRRRGNVHILTQFTGLYKGRQRSIDVSRDVE